MEEDNRVTVRIPPNLLSKIDDERESRGVSKRTTIILEALTFYFDHKKDRIPPLERWKESLKKEILSIVDEKISESKLK